MALCFSWIFMRFLFSFSPFFSRRSLLLTLQPHLRKAAGQGVWQVASSTEAVGELVKIPSLIDIQGKKIDRPQVLVIDKLFGNEDIPVRPTSAVAIREGDGRRGLA